MFYLAPDSAFLNGLWSLYKYISKVNMNWVLLIMTVIFTFLKVDPVSQKKSYAKSTKT